VSLRNMAIVLMVLHFLVAAFCFYVAYLCLGPLHMGAFTEVLGIINLGLAAANLVCIRMNWHTYKRYSNAAS